MPTGSAMFQGSIFIQWSGFDDHNRHDEAIEDIKTFPWVTTKVNTASFRMQKSAEKLGTEHLEYIITR